MLCVGRAGHRDRAVDDGLGRREVACVAAPPPAGDAARRRACREAPRRDSAPVFWLTMPVWPPKSTTHRPPPFVRFVTTPVSATVAGARSVQRGGTSIVRLVRSATAKCPSVTWRISPRPVLGPPALPMHVHATPQLGELTLNVYVSSARRAGELPRAAAVLVCDEEREHPGVRRPVVQRHVDRRAAAAGIDAGPSRSIMPSLPSPPPGRVAATLAAAAARDRENRHQAKTKRMEPP